MNLVQGQLIIILAPYIDYEIYGIIKHTTHEHILLELKSECEVPLDKEVLCIVVKDENVSEFYTSIVAKEGNTLQLIKPESSEFFTTERRQFSRVDCSIGVVATIFSLNNKSILNSDKKFTGTIKNISGGGVLVESNYNLPVGLVFTFKLKLNTFIECKAQVIRSFEVKKDVYQSGCQFVDSTIDEVKAISLYAFKERLKQKRKALGRNKV